MAILPKMSGAESPRRSRRWEGGSSGELTLWASQGGVEWAQVPDVPNLPRATRLLEVDLAGVDDRLVLVVSTESLVDGYTGGGFAVTWSP